MKAENAGLVKAHNDLHNRLVRWKKAFKEKNDGREPTRKDLEHLPRIRALFREYAEVSKETKREEEILLAARAKENVVEASPCKFKFSTRETAYEKREGIGKGGAVIANSPMHVMKFKNHIANRKRSASNTSPGIPPSPLGTVKTSSRSLFNAVERSPLRNCINVISEAKAQVRTRNESSDMVPPSPSFENPFKPGPRASFRLSVAARNALGVSATTLIGG